MKCSLCGYQFQETEAQVACKGCPMSGKCHMIRCPNCGYDMPAEPALIKKIKAWSRKNDATKRTG